MLNSCKISDNWKQNWIPDTSQIIIRSHHSTSWMRPVATDRVAWSLCNDREACKNGWSNQDAVWN